MFKVKHVMKEIRFALGTKDLMLFVDIDQKDLKNVKLDDILLPSWFRKNLKNKNWLIYKTAHGAHFINSWINDANALEDWEMLKKQYGDPLCPYNAVRIAPSDDFKLLQFPKDWRGRRLANFYAAIFAIDNFEYTVYPLYSQPEPTFHFGVYWSEKTEDGHELIHGKKVSNEEIKQIIMAKMAQKGLIKK